MAKRHDRCTRSSTESLSTKYRWRISARRITELIAVKADRRLICQAEVEYKQVLIRQTEDRLDEA